MYDFEVWFSQTTLCLVLMKNIVISNLLNFFLMNYTYILFVCHVTVHISLANYSQLFYLVVTLSFVVSTLRRVWYMIAGLLNSFPALVSLLI
jgi:hypothetical protein